MGLSVWLSVIVIAVSAAFAIGGAYQKSRFTHYAFKPLTMILIISLAWDRANAVATAYAYLVLAGLVFGLAGDILLMLPKNRLRQGMAAFMIGHILYIVAFVWGTGTLAFPALGALAAWGIGVFLILRPGLGRLVVPVVAYMAAAVLMAWLAACRHLTLHESKSLFALVGGLLFLFSDSVNGFKRFRQPFQAAEILVLVPYFAAQTLFALSI